AEGVGFGEEGDAEVVAVRHVEARAGDDQHVFFLEQLQREGVVVEAARGGAGDRGETVERALRRDQVEMLALGAGLDQRRARLVQAAAGRGQRADRVLAVQR